MTGDAVVVEVVDVAFEEVVAVVGDADAGGGAEDALATVGAGDWTFVRAIRNAACSAA